MKSLRHPLIFSLLISTLFAINANPGVNHGGGGGDPLVNEYFYYARLLQKAQDDGKIDLGLSATELGRFFDKVELSIENSKYGQKPLVDFPESVTVDCGTAKLGCVDLSGYTHFARQGWQAADDRQKIEVVTMETVKALGGKNRYSIAESVSRTLEYKDNLAATSLIDTKYKIGDSGIEKVFTENTLRLINRTLQIGSEGQLFPQIDFAAHDGLPNLKSQQFLAYLSEDFCSSWSWKRNFVVSSFDRDHLDKRVAVSTVSEKFDACPGDKQIALLQATVYSSIPGFVDFPHDGKEVPYFRQSTVPNRKPLKDFEQEGGGEPFFSPCKRDALNEALLRSFHDRGFDKLFSRPNVARDNKTFKVLSMFASSRLQEKTSFFIVNILVSYQDIDFPYSYRVAGTVHGDRCQISDIKLH